jgi:hypothetical protein
MATYYVKSGTATQWVASTAYTVGQQVVPTLAYATNGAKAYIYVCTVAGTSGGSQPTWVYTTPGTSTTTDGGVTWLCTDITSWTNATPILYYSMYRATAGDTIYVSNNHNETTAQTVSFPAIGTNTNPVKVLCANDSANPPTALATSAVVTLSTDAALFWTSFSYVHGIIFNIGSGSTQTRFYTNQVGSGGFNKFINCTFNIATTYSGTSAGLRISNFTDNLFVAYFKNCIASFSAVGQTILVGGSFLWEGGSISATGTIPSTLFTPLVFESYATINGVNLSSVTSTILAGNVTNVLPNFLFTNCSINASATLVGGSSIGLTGTIARFHNCDSSATDYRFYNWSYQGISQNEVTIVRTGGASDGSTTISWKMVSSSVSYFYNPLVSEAIVEWNGATGVSKTATVEFIHDSLTALTNADIYMEVEYQSSLTTPITSFANDRATDILATPTTHTTSSATWTTTGLTNPNKQYLTVSFTPQKIGVVKVKVYLIKPSYTVYIDPLVTIA